MSERKKKTLMATKKSKTSSTKSDSGLSATLLGGSEELFEFFCQSCSKDNVHLEAAGYCQHCREYLCDTCCKYHRKTTATQHHKLLDKADMPKSKVAAKTTDDLKETCTKHQGKLLEYFCNSHSELCCIVCLNNDHGSCKVLSHIPDVSDGIANSNELNHLMTDMKALLSNLTKQQGLIKSSTKNNDKYQSESIAGIRELRKDFDKLLDKFEENAVLNVSQLHHENSEMINAVTSECQKVVSELTSMIANLDAKAKSGKNNQLFVDMKMFRQRISAIEPEASKITDCRITQYGFHQDETIKEMIASLSAVWSLSFRQEVEETHAQYIGEISVKSDDETDDWYINGIAALPGGDIVITDFKNECLKLVDMKLKKVTSRISLSAKPYDVINTKPNQVAVSLGSTGVIEIYTVTDVLARNDTIQVREGLFDGMCFFEDMFILTDKNNCLVKIVNMSGRVLNTISTGQNGDRLFTEPRYIAIGRDGDIMYVTDQKANTVTTLTPSGHVISVYRSDKLNKPQGITVGPDHKVYVCSGHTNTVLQLSASGELQQVLLDKQRGLPVFPLALAYDDTRDRLYISSLTSMPAFVQFFQIE